ncbi:hypothetical protein DC083_01960 [Ignatzschineria ureiclastica]|uniref:Uncharacterized protein n=1 Tax=Ignatzschineria ureiclastica TaxID=472582 RepID=A0A2U2AH50_9GAMM|nr:hypothetical protein [Ignatzschineria ureiclastica]PWD81971.1 hypothetical protein DC083_01960 [Ignatzschineria ureiclastica]GGZ91752.1 hypothetical protein GCM10007162_03770 [Ignatzschineria ureiclastica]
MNEAGYGIEGEQERESGSIFVGIIIVVGLFFLFFWAMQQMLSQEWFLLRKKSAWVEKLDISQFPIQKQGQAAIVKKEAYQVGSCDLYRQKILIRDRQLEGNHSLNISDCYNDHFYKLNVDFYLDAVSPEQNISYAHYYYKVNNDSRALENASLVELAGVEEGFVLVVIRYEDQQYGYHLPLFDDGGWIQYQLVRGVDDGVMIVVNHTLWFLSFTGEVELIMRDLPFRFESILLSAFISVESGFDNDDGKERLYSNEVNLSRVYFLVQSKKSELRLYSIDLVGVGEEIGRWDLQDEWDFDEYRLLGNRDDLSLDRWNVEWLDQAGMILLFKDLNRENDRLFAVDWQGRPLWGSSAFWGRREKDEVYCGLQQTLFEPVAGWPLGCQRLRESKIVIE